jgi:hypothetical protein
MRTGLYQIYDDLIVALRASPHAGTPECTKIIAMLQQPQCEWRNMQTLVRFDTWKYLLGASYAENEQRVLTLILCIVQRRPSKIK